MISSGMFASWTGAGAWRSARHVSRDSVSLFALTHHVDLRGNSAAIRIHNYPDGWAEWFDAHQLWPTDPVHRASNITSVGFAWSKLPQMIAMTARDRGSSNSRGSEGIGDGFTVPAHVPGEAHGSCSFACERAWSLPKKICNSLQLVGAFAFEAAPLDAANSGSPAHRSSSTDRQREVVIWVASGKSDKEIGRVLGISEETVGEHMRAIAQRYGVSRRTLVAVSALFDGTIGFKDVLPRRK